MKRHFILHGIAMLCLISCSKDPLNFIYQKTQSEEAFRPYIIATGEQYCDKNKFTPIETTRLAYRVKFDSSAIYQSSSAGNQYDINKLFGFSDNKAPHHQYSARFGWRWSDQALHIFAYTYNAGTRAFKEIGTVSVGVENNYEILVDGDEYIFSLNDKKVSMERASTTPAAKGYRLFPYFGGDEKAPHEIVIWMKEI